MKNLTNHIKVDLYTILLRNFNIVNFNNIFKH